MSCNMCTTPKDSHIGGDFMKREVVEFNRHDDSNELCDEVMDLTSVFSVNPIGYMKSVFHFKNGTPRQSSLCKSARGILTIEKSIFNNPEHSLDGLQEFSHAWVIFVFHKNNNAYSKAKVRPPRLNGRKMGVFSTRSPYRPNNIGLSLAKIDSIEGSSVHLSGIDILDGTPVLDIKPYIPEYDSPLSACDIADIDKVTVLPRDGDCGNTLESENKGNDSYFKNASISEAENLKIYLSEKSHQDSQNSTKLLSKAEMSNPLSNSKGLSSRANGQEKTVHSGNEYEVENCETDLDASYHQVAEGFYSMSSALDKACTKISSKIDGNLLRDRRPRKNKNKGEISRKSVINSDDWDFEELRDTSSDDQNNDVIIDSLVDNVIAKAVSRMHQSNQDIPPVHLYENCCSHATAKTDSGSHTLLSSTSSSRSSESYLSTQSSEQSFSEGEIVEKTTGTLRGTAKTDFLSKENISPVTAPWLLNPPVQKVKVSFTANALEQLGAFSKDAANERFQLQLLSDAEEARVALSNILHQDPRSVYRRQHCQDSLYFFTIDTLHVTCWFDEDAAQVVRIKPVVDVPLLNCGEKNFSTVL